ncbi:hypothetical protein D5086_012604 [Populus alba]|uniref:Uncharacterized protein n=1 Tax=Populus alba TaxID=43335 RepID=A0ACC4C4F8_POPAL
MDSFQYSSLKCGLCEAGNFDGAVKIYKEMGGGRLKKGSGAVSVWELMRRKGSGADSTTYGVLIHGLCKNGHLNKALTILKEAEDQRDKLDALAHSSMVDGLSKQGRVDEALGILHQMDNHDFELNCLPNLVTHYTLMDGIYKASECEKASVMWACMFKYGFQLDIDTMITLIAGDVVFVLSWQYLQM